MPNVQPIVVEVAAGEARSPHAALHAFAPSYLFQVVAAEHERVMRCRSIAAELLGDALSSVRDYIAFRTTDCRSIAFWTSKRSSERLAFVPS